MLYMDKTPLKRMLFESDMTVKELSERTGIVYGTLREIVRGRIPSIQHALLIADVLSVTVEELWGYIKDRPQ